MGRVPGRSMMHAAGPTYLVTKHGRATPLVWQTVQKSELLGQRTGIEHAMIERLHGWLDPKVGVELLADRGFGDKKLYELVPVLHAELAMGERRREACEQVPAVV